MQKLLDDIKVEMDTLKGCIGRMEQRLDELQKKVVGLSELLQAGVPAQQPLPEPVVVEEPVEEVVEEVITQDTPEADDVQVHPEPTPVEAPAEVGVPPVILGDRIRPSSELRHALSLNDSFRFTRELFGGDAARMNRILEQLGGAGSLAVAMSIVESEIHVSEDNEALADLTDLLHKYFN